MATLVTRISDLATRISTEAKAIRTLVNGNAADLSSLQTTAKSNLVTAMNELKGQIDALQAASGAQINDGATASTTQTYSINKIKDLLSEAVAALTNGAPAALDTIDELAAALGDDANFGATVLAALGNRVRVDAAQALTAGQQTQARSNIGALAAADVGNTDTNFVTTFENGLV